MRPPSKRVPLSIRNAHGPIIYANETNRKVHPSDILRVEMAQQHQGHAHHHGHGHSHAPANVSSRAMGAAVALTLAFVLVEAIAGWTAHSLALLSDAGHNLADAAALGFSWYALSAVGVVIAGILVATQRVALADPLVSLLIAGLILYSSYGVLCESATVLLEGTPAGMDMPAVIAAIKSVGGVLDVHDLHVWMVGPGVVACSCHIVVAEQSIRQGQQVLRAVVNDIERRFHITHTTVQVEVEGCDANDMYCMGQRSSGVAR